VAGYQDGETPACQQVTAGRDAYVAGRDMHVHLASHAKSRDEDGLSMRPAGTTGMQIGSGNVQVNNYYGKLAQAAAEAARPVSPARSRRPAIPVLPGSAHATDRPSQQRTSRRNAAGDRGPSSSRA